MLNFNEFINEKKKWIADAVDKKGKLHKKLNIPEDEKIPFELINRKIKELKNIVIPCRKCLTAQEFGFSVVSIDREGEKEWWESKSG